jgi:predicted lipoprotein with Yx(FWY)xxD motif
MTRNKSITVLACVTGLVVVALAAAGCGSSGGSANRSSAPKTASGQSATIGVASNNLGKILVDSRGRTLYVFERDAGTKSACSGACAVNWPPLPANGKPRVGSGVNGPSSRPAFARTERPRSPTTAIRSTPSQATRSPVTPEDRV